MTEELFDCRQIIGAIIDRETGESFRVRYPTDEEWFEHQRNILQVLAKRGRHGDVLTRTGGLAADVRLLRTIQTDPAIVAFTAKVALATVEMLLACSEAECTRNRDSYLVEFLALRTIRCRHWLRIPNAAALALVYSESDTDRGYRSVKYDLPLMSQIYDQNVIESQGYADRVPATHKWKVVAEIYRKTR